MLKKCLDAALPSKSTNIYRVLYSVETLLAQGQPTTFTNILSTGKYFPSALTTALQFCEKNHLLTKDLSTKQYFPVISLNLANLDSKYDNFLSHILSASVLGSDVILIRLLFALAVKQSPVNIDDLAKLLSVERSQIYHAYSRVTEQLNTKIVLLNVGDDTLQANTDWFPLPFTIVQI